MRWLSALERRLSCPLQEHVPLAPLTTWGVEGRARFFAAPTREEDLQRVMETWAQDPFPLWILGGGSNVLLAEKELPGLTVHQRNLSHLSLSPERQGNSTVEVSGGVLLATLLGFLVRQGWGGCEHLAGIPGTLGGAIMGNAGVREGAVGDVVAWVDTVEPGGARRRWQGNELQWAYRHCALSSAPRFVTGCALHLYCSTPSAVGARVRTFMARRRHQPVGCKTAGSVFKNPEGFFAGALLEQCGCKGLVVGGARVSDRHANFIENESMATGRDILTLIQECRRRVWNTYGLLLDLEVQVWGDESENALEVC